MRTWFRILYINEHEHILSLYLMNPRAGKRIVSLKKEDIKVPFHLKKGDLILLEYTISSAYIIDVIPCQLKDEECDIFLNTLPDSVSTWVRWKLIEKTRQFFYDNDFIEIDTPVLVPSGGYEPFIEHFRSNIEHKNTLLSIELPTSPEFFLKRTLAWGFQKVFACTHAFRTYEHTNWHEPEFLMLEWYMVDTSPHTLRLFTQHYIEWLSAYAENELGLNPPLTHRGTPWPIQTWADMLEKHLGMRIEPTTSLEDIRLYIEQETDYTMPSSMHKWEMWDWLFLTFIEPNLPDSPVWIVDFPPDSAVLARIDPQTGWAQRFELFINKREIANGAIELTDPQELEKRYMMLQNIRSSTGKPPHPKDVGFHIAHSAGLPPCVGIALGLDRLIAFFAGKQKLDQSLPFPWNNRVPSL